MYQMARRASNGRCGINYAKRSSGGITFWEQEQESILDKASGLNEIFKLVSAKSI